jgi:AAA family ATP:ADP antiporter
MARPAFLDDLATLDRDARIRVLGLGVVAFFILASYELVRSPVEAIFSLHHPAAGEAWALLAVGLGAAIAVGLYAPLTARFDLLTLLGGAALVSGAALVALMALYGAGEHVVTPYLLYVWKDVYIVVVLEVFWSFANAVFPLRSARWVYGWLLAFGSFGAGFGLYVGGLLRDSVGSVERLWAVLPALGLAWAGAALLRRQPGGGAPAPVPPVDGKPRASLLEGVRVVRQSPYLSAVLGMVFTIQLVVALVDFAFKVRLRETFPDLDARTASLDAVYAWVNYASLSLQVCTGVVLKAIGVTGVLVGIPALIAFTVGAMAVLPTFAVSAVAKVAGKAFDYSLFRAAKELLYLPLSYAEKTQGKAVVDMLTYRVAKSAAAALLLGLVALDATRWVPHLALALVFGWLVLAALIARRYRARVGEAEAA